MENPSKPPVEDWMARVFEPIIKLPEEPKDTTVPLKVVPGPPGISVVPATEIPLENG